MLLGDERANAYRETSIHESFEHFVDSSAAKCKIDCVVIGIPPLFRGTTVEGRDMELRIMKHFPGVPILLEKPLAVVQNKEDMRNVSLVSEKMGQARTVCSVA